MLNVINASHGDLTPVLEAVLQKALVLCDGAFGILLTHDGTQFHTAATQGVPAAFAEHRWHGPAIFPRGSSPARAHAGEDVVHIADLTKGAAYRSGIESTRALVELGGARTLLTIALRRDGAFLGTLSVYRQEVRAFNEPQIALLPPMEPRELSARRLYQKGDDRSGFTRFTLADVSEGLSRRGRGRSQNGVFPQSTALPVPAIRAATALGHAGAA